MKSVAADSLVVSAFGNANCVAAAPCVWWNAVSKQAICGSAGYSFVIAVIAAKLCGWCSGAEGPILQFRKHSVINMHWADKLLSSVDYPMTSRDQFLSRKHLWKPS